MKVVNAKKTGTSRTRKKGGIFAEYSWSPDTTDHRATHEGGKITNQECENENLIHRKLHEISIHINV